MAIASLPIGVPPNLFYYRETISNTVERWNLEDQLDAAGWDGVQRVDVYITITSSGLVGSPTIASAMHFGAFTDSIPDDSLIILENHGRILGMGGAGGDGGDATKDVNNPPRIFATAGSNGSNGGRAFWVRTPIILRNFGKIWGGGGGGAGGGACGMDSNFFYGFAGGGGGGGLGYGGASRGNRGSNNTDWQQLNSGGVRAQHGQNGTTTSRGLGGNGGESNFDTNNFNAGDGGNGGDAGSSGGNGAGGKACGANFDINYCVERGGGSGGSAGQAINGHSFITYENVGDIKGAQVN